MDTTTHQSTIISDMLDPLTEALTPELSRRLANLKPKPSVQSRLDALAKKCNEGTLSEAEHAEYESYVRAGNILNILRAKAKQSLSKKS